MDLSEICLGAYIATSHVIVKMHEYAQAQGIPDAEVQKVDQATLESPDGKSLENLDREDS